MESIVKDHATNELFQAVAQLKTQNEYQKFFRDVCTLAELKAMAERWQVVQRVAAGETYRHISEATGASTATVTRVAHWLNYGTGGYRLILARLAKKAQHR